MSTTRRLITIAAAGLALAPPALRAQQAPLTLAEVYALAARNPIAQAAEARARATAAAEPGARTLPDPQLQLGAMNLSLPGFRTDMPSSMAPSVTLMQMLPLPGKLALAGRIAARETEMARAAAAEQGWMAREEAAMAFYDLYRADRQIAVMAETVTLLRQTEAVARAMYAAGTGRQADVLRAGVEVARMQADVARMQAMRAAAAARLNAVLGRSAETAIPAVALPPLPLGLPSADTLRAWATGTRPLLLRASAAVEQADARRQLARREIWPDLTVGVGYGQRAGEMGTERMGSVMLGVSLPVFAGRRQLAMRREAEAMGEMVDAELLDARSRVDARIAELMAELDRARTLERLYRTEVLPQADAAARSALTAYRAGGVDMMAVLDAEMAVNRFRQELAGVIGDYGQAAAALEATVGRELPRSGATLEEGR